MKNLLKMLLCFVATSSPVYAEEGKFVISGDTLFYSTDLEGLRQSYISIEDIENFREILYQNPEVKKVNLSSHGGIMGAGIEIGRIIKDFGVETIVTKECSSACTFIFVAGAGRTLAPGALLGFHRPSWDLEKIAIYYKQNKADYGWVNEFSFASWVQGDTFYEAGRLFQVFGEAGVELEFIIQTLQYSGDQMWYPSRNELLGSGVLEMTEDEKQAIVRPRARPILEPGAELVGNIELSSMDLK